MGLLFKAFCSQVLTSRSEQICSAEYSTFYYVSVLQKNRVLSRENGRCLGFFAKLRLRSSNAEKIVVYSKDPQDRIKRVLSISKHRQSRYDVTLKNFEVVHVLNL